MERSESAALLVALADPVRIRILACIATGAKTTPEIASCVECPVDEVGKNLAILGTAGLIATTSNGRISLAVDRLDAIKAMAGSESPGEPVDDSIPTGLRQFFRAGRLISMPAKRSRQIEILRVLIEDFEIGHDYPEAEINQIVLQRFEDYALIRRDFVDEGMMTRERGVYRRV